MRIKKDLILKEFRKYLNTNKLMTICTSYHNKPWCAVVFFAFDDDFNFLFVSKDNTLHCKNIAKNKNVSLAIYQNWGKPYSLKGVQIKGFCSKVEKDDKLYKYYYNIFKSRYPWITKIKGHNIYLAQPSEIWWINYKLFNKINRVKII